jgi:hypothetical protein
MMGMKDLNMQSIIEVAGGGRVNADDDACSAQDDAVLAQAAAKIVTKQPHLQSFLALISESGT